MDDDDVPKVNMEQYIGCWRVCQRLPGGGHQYKMGVRTGIPIPPTDNKVLREAIKVSMAAE